jgi:hypothetical protein
MIKFGDRVLVLATSETVSAGVAGLAGDVYGFTTPSLTGVDVIGGAPEDYALNVNLDSKGEAFWFRPDLLELLHRNAGLEISVGGITTIRQADGRWGDASNKSQSIFDKLFGWLRK